MHWLDATRRVKNWQVDDGCAGASSAEKERVWDVTALPVLVALDFGYVVFVTLELQNAH